MEKIKYISEVFVWFDKKNGNTYHSVNITECKTNKMIYSSGLTYGYGTQYETTTKKALIDLKKENFEFNDWENWRYKIYYSVHKNCKKFELKKIEL